MGGGSGNGKRDCWSARKWFLRGAEAGMEGPRGGRGFVVARVYLREVTMAMGRALDQGDGYLMRRVSCCKNYFETGEDESTRWEG